MPKSGNHTVTVYMGHAERRSPFHKLPECTRLTTYRMPAWRVKGGVFETKRDRELHFRAWERSELAGLGYRNDRNC